MKPIPFNVPFISGNEIKYISSAVKNRSLSGNGEFTKKCQSFIEEKLGAKKVLLTASGTAALEMGAILCGVKPGDEVILPSYTFVSTANAFILRGAKPVFLDIREDTFNIDEMAIKNAITPRTRVICPVHYAGVGCNMETIMKIAGKNGIKIVEDAALAFYATYNNKYLGTFGDLAAFSFHETKNIVSGEGGAVIINNVDLFERARIIWEKGTNRDKFFRGEVDKYTWVDIGSSFLTSELTAAFLYAQLENIEKITRRRLDAWQYYYGKLSVLQDKGFLRLPRVSPSCRHNGHIFYVVLESEKQRDALAQKLKENGISAYFHYLPLHTSPMGISFGYKKGDLPVCEEMSSRLLRLPMFFDLANPEQDRITEVIYSFFNV